MSQIDMDDWGWEKLHPVKEPDEEWLFNISFDDMILEMLGCIQNGTCYHTYYYKSEDGYVEIVECDLLRGRIIMANGDFSEFEWEMEESRIYREAI